MPVLDSDVETALNVEFFTFKSYEDATKQYDGKPFVRIHPPGEKNSIVVKEVTEEHKRLYPRHWLYYSMKNSPDEAPPFGTPLAQWCEDEPESFNMNTMTEMKVMKFQVVEQIANATDRQLQLIGMGAAGLRERAKRYLATKSQTESNTEMATLKAELAELRALLTPAEKRGPGRPPGSGKKDVDVNNDNAATGAAVHG